MEGTIPEERRKTKGILSGLAWKPAVEDHHDRNNRLGSYCNGLVLPDVVGEFEHDSPLPQCDDVPPHMGFQFLKP
jgi:hypothetical protein